jgi:hypothetical protein
MRIQTLIESSIFMEATNCGIYNSLLKFRPDLKDEMDEIPGRRMDASVKFLKDHKLWDNQADQLMAELMKWMDIYSKGPDEWSEAGRLKAQNELMCHLAKLIRQSAM